MNLEYMCGTAVVFALAAASSACGTRADGAPVEDVARTSEALVSPPTLRLVPSRYATIQAAVDAANPGDTIEILNGSYPEQVSIGKDLVITGSGAATTTILAPPSLRSGTLGRAVIVDIHGGANVKMSGLTVSGPGPASCGEQSLNAGIKVIGGARLNLDSARVLHIHDVPKHDCNHNGTAIGIGDFLAGEVGHATIHNVVIRDQQFNAISVFSPGTDATITDSVLDGAITASDVVDTAGIEVGNGAVAKISRNVISGQRCSSATSLGCGPDPLTQFQGTAILSGPGAPPGPGTEFAQNILSGNDVGIYLVGVTGCCSVHDNVLVDNVDFGVVVQDGSNDVSHDIIVGGSVGVAAVADAIDSVATLHGELIAGAKTKTQELQCCGFKATVVTK